MKNLKHILKNNIKFALGFIIGGVLASTSVYATTSYLFTSNEVSYNNSSSGLTSDNVKGALDELYTKANKCPSEKNIYRYNDSTWTLEQDISSFQENNSSGYYTDESSVKEKNYSNSFLKYSITGNKVASNYVGFTITSTMASANSGIKTGTYYLEGGDNGASYEKNKSTLSSVFGSKCTENTTGISCVISEISGIDDIKRTYSAQKNGEIKVNYSTSPVAGECGNLASNYCTINSANSQCYYSSGAGYWFCND